MGHRDKGYGSRGRRDRRPSPANWSSAAAFGDPTIDRPTPLTARRDRADLPERQVEPAEEQYDLPGRGTRSGSPGWESADRGGSRRAGDFDAGRREPYGDEPVRREYAADALLPVSDPGWPGGYRSEPPPSSGSDSWRDHGRTQDRSHGSSYRGDDGDGPPVAAGEPRRSRHSAEERPRRSLRALEEAARRASEEPTQQAGNGDPWRSRPLGDDLGSAAPLRAGDDGRVEPSVFSDPAAQPGWTTPEPFSPELSSRHYRDDADAGSWRTRQRTEFETWRTEDPTAQRWRSETVSWRTRETVEIDPGSVDRFGPRAIGSGESAASASAGYTDTADLEAWRSETGTWRTRDTAATGSWRLPPATEEAPPGDGPTDRWDIPATAETGSWSRSQGRWVPTSDDTGEQTAFEVRRYDDTGEIPKGLLQSTRGRVLDHDGYYDAGRRGADIDPGADSPGWRRDGGLSWHRDDGGEPRVGRRRADDSLDEAPNYFDEAPKYAAPGNDVGYRSDERAGRRSSGRFSGPPDDDRQDASESRTGAQRPRRTVSAAAVDLDEVDRLLDADPRWRSRSSRYDDDAPRYRSGRRSASGPRTARHSSDGYDEEDRRLPARTVARRAPAYAGSRGVSDNVITPRATSRGELVPVGRRVAVVDEDDADEVEEVPYGYASAGLASVGWFGLPIGAFLLWAMFLGGTARADCVTAAGRPCAAPRDAAFATFATHLPQIGVAIVLSVVVGLLIRRVSPFWRPATVGFAASVVGGGVTTILFTVVNS